jgi:hypothetical protein
MMKPRHTLIALSLCAISCWAQPSPPAATASTPTSCPSASAMDHRHLQGTWQAHIPGNKTDTVLRLGPHPEFSESVRGTLQRGNATAQVTGDVDAGTFSLEESDDGTRSCGKEIQGTWIPTDTPERKSTFVMRKQGGWQ